MPLVKFCVQGPSLGQGTVCVPWWPQEVRAWCIQSASSLQDSGQELSVLMSMDLFQPKSRFGYLTRTEQVGIRSNRPFNTLYTKKRNLNRTLNFTGSRCTVMRTRMMKAKQSVGKSLAAEFWSIVKEESLCQNRTTKTHSRLDVTSLTADNLPQDVIWCFYLLSGIN